MIRLEGEERFEMNTNLVWEALRKLCPSWKKSVFELARYFVCQMNIIEIKGLNRQNRS